MSFDFSKHELNIRSNELVSIYELKIPNSIMELVRIVVCEGRTMVNGDFGDWVVCREFHPDKVYEYEKISRGYWCEKFKSERQTIYLEEIDTEKVEGLINECIEKLDTDSKDYAEKFEYYTDLLENITENVYEFEHYVIENKPSFVDYDDLPIVKRINPQLNVVFDAMDEMIKRLNK